MTIQERIVVLVMSIAVFIIGYYGTMQLLDGALNGKF